VQIWVGGYWQGLGFDQRVDFYAEFIAILTVRQSADLGMGLPPIHHFLFSITNYWACDYYDVSVREYRIFYLSTFPIGMLFSLDFFLLLISLFITRLFLLSNIPLFRYLKVQVYIAITTSCNCLHKLGGATMIVLMIWVSCFPCPVNLIATWSLRKSEV